jgi:hypothetical protein
MDRVAVQLTNWNLNFSTFYLSNISDWFPAHTMQEQIENINNWIYSVPTVKKAVVIKSRCSRYNDLFNTQNHVVGEKNSWFYEIIPLQKKLSQSIQVAANQ